MRACSSSDFPGMSSSDREALEFIAASFPSVWALEVLLALKGDPRPWARDELVAALRASDVVISHALDALIAAGLASMDVGRAIYLPVNKEAHKSVERAERLYRTKPNAVRRAIIAGRASGASAFADAFKLRRPRDD